MQFCDKMKIENLSSGANPPEQLFVFIECSKDSKNIYEYDEKSEDIKLKEVFRETFPFNYGFIPKTHHDTGKLDALILSSEPFESGSVVEVKPIGHIRLAGIMEDDVIITVPLADKEFSDTNNISDLSDHDVKKVSMFLETFKKLKVKEVFDVDHAKKVINISIEKYQRLN